MQISKQELVRRLNSERNIANGVEHKHTRKQMARSGNLSDVERNVIATLAEGQNVPQRQVASAFGISQQTVSSCVTGRVGGKPATEDRIAQRRERQDKIKDSALTKLMLSLKLIDEDKLNELDAKGLSTVAVNMGKVADAMSPQEQQGDTVNLIVYAPQQQEMSKYRVVEVEH